MALFASVCRCLRLDQARPRLHALGGSRAAAVLAVGASLCASAALQAGEAAAQAEGISAAATGEIRRRYQDCLQQALGEPAQAREAAAKWRAAGGGAFADHCAAIALIGLGAEREAATMLTELGSGPAGPLAAEDRVSMLRLAGDLWLRQDQADLARQCFVAALSLAPFDRDSRLGAARAFAALGEYDQADQTLSMQIERDPADAEALTFRAAARRALGRPGEARADAVAATVLLETAALAWFERGAAERALGMKEAAQESWLIASELDFNGPAGDMARLALQRLATGD